jgi:DNA polymerase I-like protein with 3'-5' exonuclease and polymerase domains
VIEAKEEKAETVKAVVEAALVRAGEYFLKSVPVEAEITIGNTWKKGG